MDLGNKLPQYETTLIYMVFFTMLILFLPNIINLIRELFRYTRQLGNRNFSNTLEGQK